MRSSAHIVAMVVAAAVASPAAAVSLGQIDTFSASAEAWFAGAGPMGSVPPSPPAVVSGGGPGGAADPFLQISSSGLGGSGGRLVAMNASQWAGDYVAAGVTAIEMDLRNLGATDLTVRLLFEDPAGAAPVNIAATSFGAMLPAGSGWMHVRFPIAAGDLTAIQGNTAEVLAGTTLVRLFHSVPVAFPPEAIAATLGVDNIAAVPEPAAAAMMLTGLGVVAVAARRRRPRMRMQF